MATVTYTTFKSMIVGENRNGQKRDYMPDTLGSTAALLDNTQAQTSTWKYWPYGEVRSGGTATPFLFLGVFGYRRDGDSRAYVRARILSTLQGRWMQRDRLWPRTASYLYCLADPLGNIDPSGLYSIEEILCCMKKALWPAIVGCIVGVSGACLACIAASIASCLLFPPTCGAFLALCQAACGGAGTECLLKGLAIFLTILLTCLEEGGCSGEGDTGLEEGCGSGCPPDQCGACCPDGKTACAPPGSEVICADGTVITLSFNCLPKALDLEFRF